MKMAVCPHDSTKNKVQWLYFVTYLSEKTGLDITMEQCFDFECYYKSFPVVDITYSSPLDALKLKRERGFEPIAGNDNYDEVVIIGGKEQEASLEAINGKKVLAVENQFATYLGKKILKEMGIKAELEPVDSWQKVINGVAKGEAPYGFVYKDFWDQLSELSKRGVKVVYESDTKLSSHLIMVTPELVQFKGPILQGLEDMPKDEKGAKLIKELRIGKWYPVDSIENVEKLVQED